MKTYITQPFCTSNGNLNIIINPNPNSIVTSQGVCLSGSCGGAANITSTGGLAPYSYVWNEMPLQTGNAASNLCIGSHNVITTDANGCSTTTNYQVNLTNVPLNISLAASANPICNNGQSTNITLSGATTYVLLSSGATITNPFIVSPSATTTYFINGSNAGGCSGTGQITINVQNPPTVSLVVSVNPVCSGQPVIVTASGASFYVWNTGSTGNSITNNPTTTTTYNVTGTTGVCSVTTPITINVNPLPVISIAATPNPVCISAPVNITFSGASTYVLNGGTTNVTSPLIDYPTLNTIYTITGTDANSCVNTGQVTVVVNPLCSVCAPCLNILAPGGTLASSPAPNTNYCVNNNITITGNVVIKNSELKMAPNVVITVAPTGFLTIRSSHVYSCSDMWAGIVVQNGGSLAILNSLIEDAITAIDVTNNTSTIPNVISLTKSTFNRNNIALNVSNYNQAIASYPFAISNCVITCRNIPFTSTPISFPTANTIGAAYANPVGPLANAFINNVTYPQTSSTSYLKVPYLGKKPEAGIRLTNVGLTLNANTAAPIYYEYVLGGVKNTTIIDNQVIGVDLINSNYTSYNTIYQNMTTVSVKKGTPTGGIGINANAYSSKSDSYNNRLQVSDPLSLGTFGNKFVDCSRAINSVNYFEHIITYNDIRSSQVFPSSFNGKGKYGVKSITNLYRIYNVSNNAFYNVENGVTMDATFNIINIPGLPIMIGQYAGKINVDANTIAPQIGANAITTQYVANAIALSNLLSGPVLSANVPFPKIQTAGNTITNAYRGIAYTNWKKANSIIESNIITIVNDAFALNALQYGISINSCLPASGQNSIVSNNITGYGITNPTLYGIYSGQSIGSNVNCNAVNNTTDGIEFAGICSGSYFTQNGMTTNKYGFVLSNSASTGPLGNTSSPTDNAWLGLWPAGGRYKTATLNSSAIGNELWVRQFGGAALNPNGSGYNNLSNYFLDDYYWQTGNTGTLKYTTASPLPISCPISSGGSGGSPTIVTNFVQQLEQIALDQATYALSQTTQAKFINKAHVLGLLKNNPSLMATSPILQTFTATSVNTTRDKFTAIENQTMSGNLVMAAGLNASISPTINIESNHQDFYTSLLHYANNSLSTSDSITIATLANGCPFTDGSVVYQARVLYNVMFDTYQVFADNCNTAVGSRMQKTNKTESLTGDPLFFDAVIYPNPGIGNFNIAFFGLIDDELQLTVTDITGKVVYTINQPIINAMLTLDLTINNGIYFVKMYNVTKSLTITKKLIIQQ